MKWKNTMVQKLQITKTKQCSFYLLLIVFFIILLHLKLFVNYIYSLSKLFLFLFFILSILICWFLECSLSINLSNSCLGIVGYFLAVGSFILAIKPDKIPKLVRNDNLRFYSCNQTLLKNSKRTSAKQLVAYSMQT